MGEQFKTTNELVRRTCDMALRDRDRIVHTILDFAMKAGARRPPPQ